MKCSTSVRVFGNIANIRLIVKKITLWRHSQWLPLHWSKHAVPLQHEYKRIIEAQFRSCARWRPSVSATMSYLWSVFWLSLTQAASCVPSCCEGGILTVLVAVQQAISDSGNVAGNYMYQLLHSQMYVLPTQCIYVFCVDLRTNSDYFPIQH